MKKNYLFAISAVLIWSTLAPIAKLLTNQLPSMEVLCISSALAFLFMLCKTVVTGRVRLFLQYDKKGYAIMVGLGFIGLFLYNALYYFGLTKLTSQMACILNYLWPVMIVLFSCLILKEKMTVKKAIALGCSFAGVVVLTVNKDLFSGQLSLLGIGACILAAACYGLFSVLNKKADYDQDVAMTVLWLVCTVGSLALGLLTEEWVPLSSAQWLGILWNGFAVNAAAYLLWALALKGKGDCAGISNVAFGTPFLSLILSAIFLKEKIQPTAIIALVLIIGGILLQSITMKKNRCG